MSDGFKGQCLCGAVRYEVGQPPMMMTKCHCRDCQYISGGEASALVWCAEADFHSSGEVRTYSSKGSSGKSVHRSFCPQCGTHIYSRAEVAPQPMVFIKAGTMDKESAGELKTAIVMWTDNANAFCTIDEGAQLFPKNPEMP